MNIAIMGAAGFIGTNLALALSDDPRNDIVMVGSDPRHFTHPGLRDMPNVEQRVMEFSGEAVFDDVVEGQDLVYHLVSTTAPTTSNLHIAQELQSNIGLSANLLDACVRQEVGKVVFVSSGGTVYGKDVTCPIKEDSPADPITAYGLHKLAVEKLLHMYDYMFGLNYGIVRLSNPYGPYQRPNGMLGVVTTFVYKALKGERIEVYGDGSVVRDFIYIDDAIAAMRTIAERDGEHRMYNVGCGKGASVRDVLEAIRGVLGVELDVVYKEGRKNDVPVNFLDVGRYEAEFGPLSTVSLEDGIAKTAEFLAERYDIG